MRDYSVLEKLGLKDPAIGVKFDFFKPEGIEPLEFDRNMSLCEMFRLSQTENRAFYFSKEHNETCIGKIILGMDDFAGFAKSGMIGEGLGVFEEARANRNLYQYIHKIDRDSVNFVSFAPTDKMNYEPDVLVISAPPKQAEMVMRAATYSTGEIYTSTCTPVMGCSWFLVYPFKTGKINFILPAFVHGPTGRELYSSDTVLVSIPYRWIPTVLENLGKMKLHLEGHKSKEAYYAEFEGILKDLGERSENL